MIPLIIGLYYRPISNIICKIIENVIHNRISSLLITMDNQFGFKKNLGTEMCVFALKQYLTDYNNNNTNMFVAFLDASKAFDKINHNILFQRLKDNIIPLYIINFQITGIETNEYILNGVIIHRIDFLLQGVFVKVAFSHHCYLIYILIL